MEKEQSKIDFVTLFWHGVFYTSIITLLTWIILKSVGIIQTPFWLEIGLPLISVIFGGLALYQNVIHHLGSLSAGLAAIKTEMKHVWKKLNHIDQDTNILKQDVNIIKQDVSGLKQDVEYLKTDVKHLKKDVGYLKQGIQ